jgi:hypothetical protein
VELATGNIAVIDSCVIFAEMIRNLLLNLAEVGLFRAKWTADIHNEWMNAIEKELGIERSKLERLQYLIDKALPDAMVTGYESLITKLELPDLKDKHVLAAAIKCSAGIIITTNLKHFSEWALGKFGIIAQHPDNFIVDQIEVNARLLAIAVVRHKKSLTKSKLTWRKYYAVLEQPKIRLPKTYKKFSMRSFRQLIADVMQQEDWKPTV